MEEVENIVPGLHELPREAVGRLCDLRDTSPEFLNFGFDTVGTHFELCDDAMDVGCNEETEWEVVIIGCGDDIDIAIRIGLVRFGVDAD